MPKWRTLSRYIMNNINAQSRIKAVSSLSTTKNLAATGERLGAVALTPQASDFAKYARSCNSAAHGNNNSLLMLNNTLQTAQVAKSIKDQIEAELPKNASRSKIKKAIVRFIVNQIDKTEQSNEISKTNRQLHKTAGLRGLAALSVPARRTDRAGQARRAGTPRRLQVSGRTVLRLLSGQVGRKPEPVPDQQKLPQRVAQADENGQEHRRPPVGGGARRNRIGLHTVRRIVSVQLPILAPFSYADVRCSPRAGKYGASPRSRIRRGSCASRWAGTSPPARKA